MVDIDPKTGAPIVSDTPVESLTPVAKAEELSGESDSGEVFESEAPLFTDAEVLLSKINQKLQDAGGETNIGVTDEYWDWVRDYRKFTSK